MLLKDYFTESLIRSLSQKIIAQYSSFQEQSFCEFVLDDFEALSFSERSQRIAEGYEKFLPDSYPESLEILLATLPPELEGSEDLMEKGFWLWPLGDFIRLFGSGHVEESLHGCYELTKRFSAEFAIRPLLLENPDHVLSVLSSWAEDKNEHIRRLVSEGTRPRLPWAARLDLPVDAIFGLLQKLRADPSLYVRRSVANHLNDLGKDSRFEEQIFTLLESWDQEQNERTSWIIRHALRTHFKKGNVRALALCGYGQAQIACVNVSATPEVVSLGDSVTVSFGVLSTADRSQKLMIDLVFYFVKKNGSLSEKVFKLKDISLAAGEQLSVKKKFPMVQRSTRKLYPGTHFVEPQINGVRFMKVPVELSSEGFS